MFWVVIEFASLMFMGLSYSFISFGFSSLMLYFVVQAVSSVGLFFFFGLGAFYLVIIILFLKLAVFPFFHWFFSVAYKLPTSIFFLSSTFQKFPPIIFIFLFLPSFPFLFFVSLVLTVSVSSIFMINAFSFRLLLSFSSVGGNAWFIFSGFSGLEFFLFFFLIYSLNFYLLCLFIKGSVKLFFPSSTTSYVFLARLMSMGGFPPFPVFFLKLYILQSVVGLSYLPFGLLVLFLLSVVVMIASYMRYLFGVVTSLYCNSSLLVQI